MQTPRHPPGARLRHLVSKLPRLSGWLFINLALLCVVLVVAPHQLPVSLYKLSLVTLAGVVGYWLDRSLFPYARPDVFLVLEDAGDTRGLAVCDVDDQGQPNCTLHAAADSTLLRLMGLAMLRRAIIVAAAMIAMGLGA